MSTEHQQQELLFLQKRIAKILQDITQHVTMGIMVILDPEGDASEDIIEICLYELNQIEQHLQRWNEVLLVEKTEEKL